MSLAEFAGPDRLDIAGRAALVAAALRSRGVPALRIVFGAGLWGKPGTLPQPVVLVDPSKVGLPVGQYLLPNVPVAFDVIRNALGITPPWLSEIHALVRPTPLPQAQVGDQISLPTPGRVGCRASWNGGSGFLTAGHVALAKGGQIYYGSNVLLGTVEEVSNPNGQGSTMMPDVGVVRAAPGVQISTTLGGTCSAGPNAAVDVHVGTVTSADIMGLCSFVYVPSVNGTYGDTYFTTQSVTVGGDSGAAVAIGNDIVGLVVAGTSNYTTYIQDIRYLVANVPSGVTGLTV